MNRVGSRLDKILWALTGKHSQEASLKQAPKSAVLALLAGLAVCC
jgi:hypothetical protein